MKIVILDGYTENPGDLSWEGFAALGELTVYERTAAADIVPRIGDAEIVYTNKTPITAETLAVCPEPALHRPAGHGLQRRGPWPRRRRAAWP